MKAEKLRVLLVDDDRIDVMSIKRALQKSRTDIPVFNARNGQEALDKLREGNLGNPLLILLDINMPVMNGIEFLKHLRSDQQLSHIPVIILTTSDEARDITNAYDLHAAGYIVKPLHFDDMEEVVKQIVAYWAACELPDENRSIS